MLLLASVGKDVVVDALVLADILDMVSPVEAAEKAVPSDMIVIRIVADLALDVRIVDVSPMKAEKNVVAEILAMLLRPAMLPSAAMLVLRIEASPAAERIPDVEAILPAAESPSVEIVRADLAMISRLRIMARKALPVQGMARNAGVNNLLWQI